MKKSKNRPHSKFTLDGPVTRMMIVHETGLSYSTVCRRLKELDIVPAYKRIMPLDYAKILTSFGILDEKKAKYLLNDQNGIILTEFD